MKLPWLASLALAAPLAACGADDEDRPIDAPTGIVDGAIVDAAVIVDATDATPSDCSVTCSADAPIDAPIVIDAPSAVQVISCTGTTPVATIAASNFMFSNANPTIQAGSVIRVTVTGSHTFTSDTGLFDTVIGADTCVRFMAAGSFPYHCAFHPSMTGTVTVN